MSGDLSVCLSHCLGARFAGVLLISFGKSARLDSLHMMSDAFIYPFNTPHSPVCNSAGNASHLIPVELALKVASKIEAGQPFGCVVVLPMYSEGTPCSQTILATFVIFLTLASCCHLVVVFALHAYIKYSVCHT